MRDDDFSCFIKDLFVLLILGAIVWLMTSCSSSRKVASDRETKDSMVYIYKTHYRDSLRVKDSTVLVYGTVLRDSVVLRVDKATGEVISTDTWHWRDTNRNKDHVSDVRNKTEKSDSTASVVVKSDKREVIAKDSTKPLDVKKTHYWKIYWLGMLTGILVMLLWKYRKTLINLLKKAIRLI